MTVKSSLLPGVGIFGAGKELGALRRRCPISSRFLYIKVKLNIGNLPGLPIAPHCEK
jgi:hypothetical protein